MAVERIHQNSQSGDFCEELLCENDFEAVLANFCCYEYGANASGGSSENRYRIKRLSQMLLVCYSLLNSHQSITVKKGWLLGHLRRS